MICKHALVVSLNEQTFKALCWVALDAVPQGSGLAERAEPLAAQGAIGLLTPLYANADGYLVKRITAAAPIALPMLSVRADLLSTFAGTRIQATVPVVSRVLQGLNILARLEGTYEHLADAPVLIGAHYDAIGDDPGGFHHPGATDNAAAVAMLLELARALPLISTRPRRPILLVAFDAEEVGAQGSRALAQQYKAIGQAPLVLNLDGAACMNDAVWIEPGGTNADMLLQALDLAGRWLTIPLIQGNIASDQRQFAREGFASVGISVGATKLHTLADAIEQVQQEAVETASRLLLAPLYQLAW